MNWIKDLVNPKARAWEEFYRNRWQHDKVVRSTHGVNCTGGCSWNIYVKQGIVTWEMQALDYPKLEEGLPPYEPRGCQRGISFSWYLYSPIRVRYPYVRGALLDIWRAARDRYDDPVDAWESIVNNPELRSRFQRARGKGGFRRGDWDELLELIAASTIHTIRRHGPDRVTGFSPIPAMSFLSYAAGARFLQVLGGVNLSFYDCYCDLPPASPEVWGEQTDVAESADWYNSKFIAVMGSNLNMTRTPDCHFAAESRHNGTKVVVLAPDFNQVAKFADQWIPLHAGQDAPYWLAVNHVILTEFHHRAQTPYFLDYVRRYTDAPFLVELEQVGDVWRPSRLVRAGAVERYASEENGEWKFLVHDRTTGEVRMPAGSVGHRWGSTEGKWNLMLEDAVSGEHIDPALTLIDASDEVVLVSIDEFGSGTRFTRGVPARAIETTDGRRILAATAYDLMMAQFGVDRGLPGEWPTGYDDAAGSFTPAWQEQFTGVSAETVVKFAREWASTAEKTGGRCSVIIGAGINHWYHNNLMYRSAITALMLCGCVGRNGGGLNHYVGQEKLALVGAWGPIAFARDWVPAVRLQNAPSWHYVHSEQWRYEGEFTEYHPMPEETPVGEGAASIARGHTIDIQAKAVRNGWLPFYPQFDRAWPALLAEARAAGATSDEDIIAWVVGELKAKRLRFANENPSDRESWPRVWFIWRGNALMSSAKGHEFFMKHYLGTHHNEIAEQRAEEFVKEVIVGDAPEGKLDLVVDLNFRMDTSALYSDIVLPAATWYEKADLNSTDMHSFIHPLSKAVPPCWESRSDWDIFRALSEKVSELAIDHLPDVMKDLVVSPLAHDTPDEITQPTVKDWGAGECEPVPGRTMPHMKMVDRDYTKLYDRFISLGPNVRANGMGAHGVKYAIADLYDEIVESRTHPTVEHGGQRYPSLYDAEHAADLILHLAPETNGELAYRAYETMEKKVGLRLTDLAEGSRDARTSYKDLQAQPRRLLNSPVWSGLLDDGRAYSAFTYNVERLVPWRTLTGRQQFYLDHEGYIAYGESLPTYKPIPPMAAFGDVTRSQFEAKGKALNFLTPHGKWHIHSTYGDNHRMMTLSRGCEPLWMNDRDAEELEIADNDWVEIYNDNGVVCTRAAVSARIPRGICIQYHSPERTLGVPKMNLRDRRRAGGHNSLTRVRLKPVLMVGGYAQFTYHFNYWGPTGVNRDTTVLVRRMEKVEY